MKTSFLYRQYAKDNADIADHLGGEDDVALEDHYIRYGAAENRGVPIGEYLKLEGVLGSEQGHIFLSGWADRRLLPTLSITIEVGYLVYELGPVEPVWFHRDDVAHVTGDNDRPSGFVALLRIPDITLHARMLIRANGTKIYENPLMRWRSAGQFLDEALGACAQLADRPAGAGLAAAEQLLPAFREVWQTFLSQARFTKAFEHRTEDLIDQSVIIAIYRKADMLIPQLECLAGPLRDTATEVVVVANQLQQPELVVERLAGFCQLHDIRLRLYLCSDNSGFSAANNFGAARARGQTLVFMNPDIFPPETGSEAEAALAFLTSDPGEALVGAPLYYGDGMLMHSGMYVASDIAFDARTGLSQPILRVEHFGKGLSHHIADDGAALTRALSAIRGQPVLATAALWKIRKSLFDRMGGLSTDYLYAYYEDADFCLRLREAGSPIEIDPTARWIHMEGVGKDKPPNVRSFMWLNRTLFTQRFASSPLVAPAETDLYQL